MGGGLLVGSRHMSLDLRLFFSYRFFKLLKTIVNQASYKIFSSLTMACVALVLVNIIRNAVLQSNIAVHASTQPKYMKEILMFKTDDGKLFWISPKDTVHQIDSQLSVRTPAHQMLSMTIWAKLKD